MFLREYQKKINAAVMEKWTTHQSTLVVAATGVGKTVCFAHLIKDMQPCRAMCLSHRDELLLQAKEKIEQITGFNVEIEKADLYASQSLYHKMPVVVSSIQTQISGPVGKRRYERFDPFDFGLLICDEGHHAVSKSWQEVIKYYCRNPKLKVLAVTATPDRGDKLALGQVFQSVAYEYEILDAIKDGYLVDITQQYVSVGSLDFSHVRTTAGDLNEGDLSKIMEAEENIQGICQPSLEVIFGLAPKTLSAIPVPGWREYLVGLNKKPRRTIVFTVSVLQAEMCANVFSRAMDGVEWVCGKTPKEKRRAMLARFAIGETHVMVNCGVLLEGFDNPGVEVIVMARPTKSRALYAQAIGRSTRPLPGIVDGLATAEERRVAIAASPKPFCRILDFVGNSGKHKLISCADILGGKISEDAVGMAKAKALKEGKPVRILVTMSNAESELERQKQEAAERVRQQAEARKAHLLAKTNYSAQDVNPFGHSGRVPFHKTASRDGRMFTEKQSAVLRRAGVNPNTVAYRQGQAIIGKIFSVPSEKQVAVLRKHGYDTKGWDRKKATETLNALAENGWRRAA